MKVFPELPELAPGPMVKGDRTYDLLEDLHHNKGTVPKGFRTDGLSIPRIFWSIFSPMGKALVAGIIHDHGYSKSRLKRKVIDLYFLANMKTVGVGWVSRHAIYRAVRLGGWRTWRKYRK